MRNSQQPTGSPPREFYALLAGAVLLLVVHTLGRFIYTPLLPYFIDDGMLTAQQGAAVATWNYLGYLLGALLAIRWHSIPHIRILLPVALWIHVLTTLAQTQLEGTTALGVTRCLNGIANGIVFVQAPALILEWLVSRNRAALSGLVYLGVGVGLLLSSALVSFSRGWLEGPGRWWPAALVSLPLVWWGIHQLMRLEIPTTNHLDSNPEQATKRLLDRTTLPLFLSYAGAGLGYILPMTFLPLLASLSLTPEHWLTSGSWLIVALATIPSPWVWNTLGARMGDLPALRLNFLVQLTGVLAAVFVGGAAGIMVCGLLVGGTFLGTVLLTQRIGRALQPHQGPKLSAALVALYGLAQIAGPWLTKQWLSAGGTLSGAFGIGAAALIFGVLFSLLTRQHCPS
ncbi:MAG: YbfB/YjiJ family MFS transporter [Gammaproteobacteria bacterium]|nr:MAG: YbfB/YjiJ family MFS transporter [Gammaproteobacteria bacterium]